jgi:hypothetical protein
VQHRPARVILRSDGLRGIAGQQPVVETPELKLAVRPALDLVALFMDGAVMESAEQGKVGERGEPALRPVPDVMTLAEGPPAAREAAAAVTMVQRAP